MADLKITFTRQHNYLMVLDARRKRELADYLDITVKTLDRLIDKGDLYDEHGDELIAWVSANTVLVWETSYDAIEIDKILAA